ncbi:unnamed protein product [Coffea canephora]|uniref:Pectinesterase inhibitor domain-containing protein n=2 Tax=Coffea TaxID=13442 RepID=A0A068TR99_COFCA|nr:cell wall / vacuolar inhibitor of fructosidase 1-like [Coffea arabica]CDO98741.1 unnamed protein product [Coffea canephora]
MKSFAFSCIVLAILPSLSTSYALPPLKKSNHHIFMVREKVNDLIENTCRNTPDYQLCFSTLLSDPRSFDADTYGLGLIIVDALKDKATSAVNAINRLKGSNPEFIRPLIKCSISYNAILKADIPEAIEGLRKGVPKFAEYGMADTAVEVQGCENSFKQSNSPLTDLNKQVYDLSIVAKSIIRMLL